MTCGPHFAYRLRGNQAPPLWACARTAVSRKGIYVFPCITLSKGCLEKVAPDPLAETEPSNVFHAYFQNGTLSIRDFGRVK